MLNDNNILGGEVSAHYYQCYDLIIDILNECLSDNPNEQEIRNLYNQLNYSRTIFMIWSENAYNSFNKARTFYNKPPISFKFNEYSIGPNLYNKAITNDNIKSVINAHTLSSAKSSIYDCIIMYDNYIPIKEVSKEFDEYKNNKEKKKD